MKDTHTPNHPVRMEKSLWDAFGAVAGVRRRAELIRAFVRWYLREPGAELPERPVGRAERSAIGDDCRKLLMDWKFAQAASRLRDSVAESERAVVDALRDVFGDDSRLAGPLGVIVAAAVRQVADQRHSGE